MGPVKRSSTPSTCLKVIFITLNMFDSGCVIARPLPSVVWGVGVLNHVTNLVSVDKGDFLPDCRLCTLTAVVHSLNSKYLSCGRSLLHRRSALIENRSGPTIEVACSFQHRLCSSNCCIRNCRRRPSAFISTSTQKEEVWTSTDVAYRKRLCAYMVIYRGKQAMVLKQRMCLYKE